MSVRAGSTVRGVSIQDSTFNGSGTFHYRFLNKDSTMISRLWPATVLNGKTLGCRRLCKSGDRYHRAQALSYSEYITIRTGQTPYASYLAGTMSDPNKTVGTGGNETYTVTCVIDRPKFVRLPHGISGSTSSGSSAKLHPSPLCLGRRTFVLLLYRLSATRCSPLPS